MNSERPVSELVKLMPEILSRGETVKFSPQGRSMRPTIREGDVVTLVRCDYPRLYDILLYTRSDGKAVLHRLIAFNKDGSLVMRGDGQTVKEYGITPENIVARVHSVERKGKIRQMSGAAFEFSSLFAVLRCDAKSSAAKIIRIIKKRA